MIGFVVLRYVVVVVVVGVQKSYLAIAGNVYCGLRQI